MSTVDRRPDQGPAQPRCPSCGRHPELHSFTLARGVMRDGYHCSAGHGWIVEWVFETTGR